MVTWVTTCFYWEKICQWLTKIGWIPSTPVSFEENQHIANINLLTKGQTRLRKPESFVPRKMRIICKSSISCSPLYTPWLWSSFALMRQNICLCAHLCIHGATSSEELHCTFPKVTWPYQKHFFRIPKSISHGEREHCMPYYYAWTCFAKQSLLRIY